MTANARARALLATALEVQETEIEPSATINNTALWNSLTHADLIVAIETEIGRPLTSEENIQIESLEDIVAILKSCELD
jgi:acyl carrier protein